MNYTSASIKQLHNVLTTENDFKPKSTVDMFPVRAHFLIDICEYLTSLEKTLEWYADEQNHIVQYGSFNAMLPPKIMEDGGERARQALKGDNQ